MTDREMLALRRLLALGMAIVAALAAMPPLTIERTSTWHGTTLTRRA